MNEVWAHADALPASLTVDPPWDYTGLTGPETWAQQFDCGTGPAQSPIDLTGPFEPAAIAVPHGVLLRVNSGVVDTGRALGAFPLSPAGTMSYAGQDFRLVQAHVHTPSEHRWEGSQFLAEFHIVFASASGSFLAFGYPAQLGEPSPRWDAFIQAVSEVSATTPGEAMMPWDDMARFASGDVLSYDGSLTIPPCTESVTWFVARDPISISPQQAELLTGHYPGNVRPVQPINDRRVRLIRATHR